MERLLLLYLRDKRTAGIVFLCIFLLQIIIGLAFYRYPDYDSNFTHLMYVAVTFSAFFFPLWIALSQNIVAGLIMGHIYAVTNVSRNGNIGGFLILTLGYFISATLIIGLLKNKIIDFYLRKEEIFYVDEFTGLHNISALSRDVQHFTEQGNVQPMLFLLVEIVNQKEISTAFGMQLYYKLLQKLEQQMKIFFQTDLKTYQIHLNMLGILFPPNEGIDSHSLQKRIAQTVEVDNIPIFFNVACGSCVFPRDGTTVDELLQKSFLALLETFRRNQNYCEYSPNLKAPQKVLLLGQMQNALEQEEIVFHYQPIMSVQGSIQHIEALVRWDHPQMGLLLPSDFIPDLELTEISDNLVEYALDYNLHNLKQLSLLGFDMHLAINVTIKNLQKVQFAQRVLSFLKRYRLKPSVLILEITERGFLADAEESNRNIKELSESGVSFHIDDFGVGFTSLGNLRKFGIRSIKIDQSFIIDMQEDPINRALVDSVIAMAKAVGISTVAEGVESMEMLDILRKMGVDYFQGYAIARPMPFEELCVWLQENRGQTTE